jgi:hypothetical protein
MSRIMLATVLALSLVFPVDAARHHKHKHHRTHHVHKVHKKVHFRARRSKAGVVESHSIKHPPFAWCGWYMMKLYGETNKALLAARNWARWGRTAKPGPGVVVVWPHHVGKIVGKCSASRCLVHSGNDGHMVKTRWRSVAGAIAFRTRL